MKYLIFGLVFVFVVLPLITWFINTIHIYGLKLVRCRYALIPESKLKRHEKQLFDQARTALESLGFEFSHHQGYADIVQNVTQVDHMTVYWHPKHQLYAEVSLPKQPHASSPFAIDFVALYRNHALVGKSMEAEGVFKGCDELACVSLVGQSVPSMLESFLSNKKDFESNHAIESLERLPAQAYTERLKKNADDYLRFLFRTGKVTKKKDKEGKLALCATFASAMKLSWQLMKKKSPPPEPLSKQAHEEKRAELMYLHQVEANAHMRANSYQDASQLKQFGKLMLFIGSVIVFGLVIGIAWDLMLVLLLAPVLLFHELGHYWAMKAFGYRDLQILFLPIGAVAMGKKSQPTPLQKTWVSLAGPVPGLLLALILVLWQPSFMINMYVLGVLLMLVIINYLNLMPFMPLDGGHVVNDLVFSRWPVAQLVFKVVGVLVFAYFAWAWSDMILTFLAVFLGFGLKNNWREYQLIKQIDEKELRSMSEFDQLSKIYQAMASQNSLFAEKMVLAQSLLARYKQAVPKAKETLIGMSVYLFFLVSPVVFVDRYMDMDLLAVFKMERISDSDDSYSDYHPDANFNADQWEPSYYQKRVAATSDVTEKKAIYQEALAFAEQQEYQDFVMPLAEQAVRLYESNGWQDETDYRDWKRMALTQTIFENHDRQNEEEWHALNNLMVDEPDDFYQLVSQSMYGAESHVYENQFVQRMDQLKTEGKWSTYVDMFLAYRSMRNHRGDVYDKIKDSEDVLALIPENEVEAINQLQQNLVVELFAEKSHEKVIDVYQSVPSTGPGYEYLQRFYLSHAIWSAIESDQTVLATAFIEQMEQILIAENDALMEEVGFLGQLVMNQSNDAITTMAVVPMKLALALRGKNDQLTKELLTTYLDSFAIDAQSEDMIKNRVNMMMESSQKERKTIRDVQVSYIVQAIRVFKPELIQP